MVVSLVSPKSFYCTIEIVIVVIIYERYCIIWWYVCYVDESSQPLKSRLIHLFARVALFVLATSGTDVSPQ
jgi:hypothetical protein